MTTLTKAVQQKFPQIKQIKIVEVNNSFPTSYQALHITKATDLWSF